jgi:SAM-dependent methyltransferase
MFDRQADGYDARPGYPSELFDLLAERCGLASGSKVLEIGPGTGQATLPMLDRDAAVTAVEPGLALAERLRRRTSGRAIDVITSDFEDADLGGAAFDIVASATAFHWIDIDIGIAKCADALRDGGWLAVWWTFWGDADRPDPFHEALLPILQAKAPQLATRETSLQSHAGDAASRADDIARSPHFDSLVEETFRWEGNHDPAQLRAIFATFSGWIAQPEPLRTELLDDVERLATDEFEGRVTRPYRTVLYTAQRVARGNEAVAAG